MFMYVCIYVCMYVLDTTDYFNLLLQAFKHLYIVILCMYYTYFMYRVCSSIARTSVTYVCVFMYEYMYVWKHFLTESLIGFLRVTDDCWKGFGQAEIALEGGGRCRSAIHAEPTQRQAL